MDLAIQLVARGAASLAGRQQFSYQRACAQQSTESASSHVIEVFWIIEQKKVRLFEQQSVLACNPACLPGRASGLLSALPQCSY